ncbi:ATP-binding protein [Paenibacillus sp. DMB5]|uniref:ATP-binding protein n=1 Tax=Paenibacillus sp. DMB5 TaxID=1780103 RepID=UPI000FE13E8E|nr:ATP-binding protein [Paenibacillus sp. DMB5]
MLASGEAWQDQELELNGITLLVSRVPIRVNGEIAGAIATFRDKTELIVLAERLSGISVYADALRAGAHEFMNKLHVIMGMTHMGLYEELEQYISGTVSNYQNEIGSITRQIKDPVMAGFLLGKLSRAREAGTELALSADSYLPEAADPQTIHELITIAGNLLDNAMDALEGQAVRAIELAFTYESGILSCTVQDSGPGIPDQLQQQVYVQGFSTKGEGRGFGLYLVRKSVEKLGGRLEVLSRGVDGTNGTGTTFAVEVPYAVKDEESI